MICSTVAITAVLACFQVIVYLDGRCRRDVLDLRLFAQDIGLGEEVESAGVALAGFG